MAPKITYSLSVQVAEGPKISDSKGLEVDAYDLIEITVPPKTGTTPGSANVEVQPGPKGRVQFLLISSDHYGDALTYKVNDTANSIRLDGLQMFVGDGQVALLGENPPETLKFSNKMEEAAAIRMLVGRYAMPHVTTSNSPSSGPVPDPEPPPEPEPAPT